MVDEDRHYRKESEIDKAFVYLDDLDNQIKELKDSKYQNNFNIFSLFSKKNYDNLNMTKKKILKSQNFIKDGYEFRIRLESIYTENHEEKPTYYIFYSNIKYYNERRPKQFYKEFGKENDALNYFKDMQGVFTHLKRRDLMEKLFDMKLKIIKSLK